MPISDSHKTRKELETVEKSELIKRLSTLENDLEHIIDDPARFQYQSIVHELQVHQVELETQNRELRATQDLLEESRNRYAELYEYAPVGYCTLDAEGRIEEINLMATKMLRLPRSVLLRQSLCSYVCLDSQEEFLAHLYQCIKSGEKTYSEIDFDLRKSVLKSFQIITVPKRSTLGGTKGTLVAFIDISEQKIMKAQVAFLSHVSERLSEHLDVEIAIAETVRMAVPFLSQVVCLDVAYGDRAVSRAITMTDACKTGYGHTYKEIDAFYTPGDDYIRKYVDRSRKGVLLQDLYGYEAECFLQDTAIKGTIQKLQGKCLMAVPLYAHGHVLGALTLIHCSDGFIYDKRDFECAKNFARRAAMAIDNAYLHNLANRAVQARDSMLAVVSHDLRNPLSVISMKCERLLNAKKVLDAESVRRSAGVISRCATRMNALIGDLLDISSIEASHFSVVKQAHDAKAIVEEILETTQPLAEHANVSLASQFTLDAQIICDSNRTLQVLGNLLTNAIKFTSAGGRVFLNVCRRGNEAVFSIEDTGKGMTNDEMQHAFDRFWQADKSVPLGVGLGLSITRGIVEASGGRIWVESEFGVGSTFYFTLPLDGATTSREPAFACSNILLVEDQEDCREALQELLVDAGYHVKAVNNGQEALTYLHEHDKPKIIFLDLQMPVMDGWQFLEERKKDWTLLQIPTVVYSSEIKAAKKIEAARAVFLPKTTPANELLRTVKSIYS